ncbi:MAG: hypothetical protein M3025_08675, partial [Actinomycetota bacterium]|nr:hypothetical protein [Actinomycetota bacterium]
MPDLLFGSNVLGTIRSAGHDGVLVSELRREELEDADALIVDLTADARRRVELVGEQAPKLPMLAFYA